jgi:UDP-glucose:(heptosyl)LPS alpha-1,3-glucosyltransferase
LTVLEALASGLPVITTRFNGAADVMISDRGGRVIDDPMDVVNLAESIALFIDDGRRHEARVVAREWMERYPPERHVEEILKVYREVAE